MILHIRSELEKVKVPKVGGFIEGEAPCGIAEMMPREQDARERFDWFPYSIMFKKMKVWAASFMGVIDRPYCGLWSIV